LEILVKLKLFLLFSYVSISTISCTYGIGNLISNSATDKKIVVVEQIDTCMFLTKIKTQFAPFSKKYNDAPIAAVSQLKGLFSPNNIKGNALFNIRMTEQDFPLAEAEVYKCPDEIFQKYKPLQMDKEYILSQIKFDLKEDEKSK
tara:strand:- start:20727 stop:21161 length:435 start_codon:yes stop_codon:yes gene_type:complete